ncbi:uncharacterized protein LOC117251394 isoform X2 [Epinephelus lanceolatus]|uniref:uncharacterized protein LOC117251394 isoform X2 n=1 Tax=Epinephelus lanceolatus TaxID=310571 RepID=UPI001447A818|nr:uncharacterized protein LOC117251394 isoform X2 [Epinephelus lanceolatus]
MVERFMEQFDAIQAAALDQRLRKPMEKDRLERFTQADLMKAEEFIKCMQVLYTSTLCVSSEKSPTCSQIIPILTKLEAHFRQCDEDTGFTSSIKQKVWGNLQNRYQDENLQKFLKEATLMDPRFKGRLDEGEAADVWDRLEKAAVANATAAVAQVFHCMCTSLFFCIML